MQLHVAISEARQCGRDGSEPERKAAPASAQLAIHEPWCDLPFVKAPCLILLTLALVGCSAVRHQSATLTNEKASELARGLADAKAQALYDCQPFTDGAARFDNRLRVCHDQSGRGLFDYEATVELAADGTARRVDVDLLSSRPR
jgi:hypothetical protein